MFATIGVGAQLVCSSGDPTALQYELEGRLGGLLEFTGTGLAAGAQADFCTRDGPDVRLGPVVRSGWTNASAAVRVRCPSVRSPFFRHELSFQGGVIGK